MTDSIFPLYRFDGHVTRYSIEVGNGVRLRSASLGARNDETKKKMIARVGHGRLNVLRVEDGQATVISCTEEAEEITAPTIFFVPHGLSEGQEKIADEANGGVLLRFPKVAS